MVLIIKDTYLEGFNFHILKMKKNTKQETKVKKSLVDIGSIIGMALLRNKKDYCCLGSTNHAHLGELYFSFFNNVTSHFVLNSKYLF